MNGMKSNPEYDFLIVGSGFFGAVCARELTNKGFKCLIIDKRSHIAGNCYTETIENINVHKYGAHIFHTNDKSIWDYVNKYAEFNNYVNSPIANYKDKLYNLPFNMNTFYQLWGVKTPEEAKLKLKEQTKEYADIEPNNLEEQALKLIGKDIYEKLIKGYTRKQWGRELTQLPAFIIKRLPIRLTFDNNYFNDKYQGIPIGGYTKLIEKLIDNIPLKLNVDYLKNRDFFNSIASRIIYTGALDEFYDFEFGNLEYRSIRFETELLDQENFQGNAVVNYTDIKPNFTRIIEHKHFEFGNQSKTVISKEFSKEWEKGDEPYYPVNDTKNNLIYKKYKEKADLEENFIFGGRLAEYKYYDMHQVIGAALVTIKKITNDNR